MGKQLRIVAIGLGDSFGRGMITDVLKTPEFGDLGCTLALVDTDPQVLDRMSRLARRVKEHYGFPIAIEATTDRRQALPGADYVLTSVAIKRYPLWEQDFRLPLAYGFRHVLGENGGPGALFHALRNFELMIPICRDMEDLCPEALLLNYTNPESRIVRAVTDLTRIRAIGLCHGAWMARNGICQVLGHSEDEFDMVSGGLNHFFWVTRITDHATGADLYPAFRERALTDPDCPEMPPLVRKLLEVFGLYTIPSDDHVGEYLSFASEFTGLTWHYGGEVRPVPRQEPPAALPWLEPYASGEKPIEEVLGDSGELGVPIIRAQVLNRRTWADAVNVPNRGGFVPGLPQDVVVEVPAWVDGAGVRPEVLDPLPEAITAFCRTQASIQKLLVEAYRERSRNLLLQALLLDPVVDSVKNAEALLDDMLTLQRDYLPAFT